MITTSGEFKGWKDMTPAERKRDQLRHFPTLLARWAGGRASIWELTVSLKTLTVRVERSGIQGNLDVHCIGPSHIHGPVFWDNCEITVSLAADDTFIVLDVRAGLEIRTASVEVTEHC